MQAQHGQDENSARDQADSSVGRAKDAHLASGIPGAEPPLEREGARHGRRELTAAGLTSIYETARHGFAQMGVARTVRMLTVMNQKDGFDCPSCAWPDPDGERKLAEFCENGAKALASEA